MARHVISRLRKQGKEGAHTWNCAVPREEVPEILQRNLKQSDWAFEARSTVYKSLNNVCDRCSTLNMGLVFSTDAKLFSPGMATTKHLFGKGLFVLGAAVLDESWLGPQGHELLQSSLAVSTWVAFSFATVGCFIPLFQSWGGTLLPEEIAYMDFEVCIYVN